MRQSILLFAVGLFAFPASGRAQVPIYDSVESSVGCADVVAVGTITDISKRVPDREGEPYTITVRVEEMVKGSKVEEMKIENRRLYDYSDFVALAGHHVPLLLCVRQSTATQGGLEFWRMIPIATNGLDDNRFAVRVFGMDYSVLTTRQGILDRARRFVKDHPGRLEEDVFQYVPYLIGVQFEPNAGGWLDVPVIPGIEDVARRMIESPGSFLPNHPLSIKPQELDALRKVDEGNLRYAGIGAMHRFKSLKNIDLLKRYVNDPFSLPTSPLTYPVRDAARRVLREWGVDTPSKTVGKLTAVAKFLGE